MNYPFYTIPNVGMIGVPEQRLKKLAAIEPEIAVIQDKSEKSEYFFAIGLKKSGFTLITQFIETKCFSILESDF